MKTFLEKDKNLHSHTHEKVFFKIRYCSYRTYVLTFRLL